MKTKVLRSKFLEYFKKLGHAEVPSSPLVPREDKTLLFTNAGMVQFKNYFLGLDNPPYHKATSSQFCVRAGGKHNDLDNVGYTKRHHTFFEMLGNFSFGDYFKKEAIKYSWDFITKELGIPENKLWVTIYKDDKDTANIWLKEIGISANRISFCGKKDNFWSMGLVGPCGPCTEIFYDHGDSIDGGPPGSADEDGDRFVEIWNLVFMEFERLESGELRTLPMKSVDTGMGLERISAVLQGVHDNYEIDLFQSMIASFRKILPIKNDNLISLKVIADHIRSISFLIVEGIQPNNDGRGYVLRRIIRRAIRYGTKLGIDGPFVYKLVEPLVVEMGEHYKSIAENREFIAKVIKIEEEQFGKTLYSGLKILERDLAGLKSELIPGELIFKMYDTYGFPVDLLRDVAKERNLSLDIKGYNQCMENQRELARKASNFGINEISISLPDTIISEFTGYENQQEESKVIMLLQDGEIVDSLNTKEQFGIVLDKTPFYAESGGQVGDTGTIIGKDFKFEVNDTQKIKQAIIHYGKLLSGNININDKAISKITQHNRASIKNNHTATHLLHAALKKVLGDRVEQKGSIVRHDKLRFDFSHNLSLTEEEIFKIEEVVNDQIRSNVAVDTDIKDLKDAVASGAEALFGEKYEDSVRVVSVGSFSKELCGGTHVSRTGDIGVFKIISEYSIATGIRRIEAITGEKVIKYMQKNASQLMQLTKVLNSNEEELVLKVQQLIQQVKLLKNKQSKFDKDKATSKLDNLVSKVNRDKDTGIHVLVEEIMDIDSKNLKILVDDLVNRYQDAIIVLVTKSDNKINAVCKITKSCIGKIDPRTMIKIICDGKGGGRDDMAQGGTVMSDPNIDLLDKLKEVRMAISDRIISK